MGPEMGREFPQKSQIQIPHFFSAIYCSSTQQLEAAMASAESVQLQLTGMGFGEITTEIMAAPEFFYAEEYHQQYLAKNPAGYCGLRGTGISCG